MLTLALPLVVGWFAAAFEWSTVYILFSPANKVITKDQIRKVFDVSRAPLCRFLAERPSLILWLDAGLRLLRH